MGKIQAICSSDVRGIAKSVIPEGRFKVDWGLEGDAHAGHWHRQVSLLGLESIEDFRRRGGNVEFGAFGENLVVDGFIFSKLPVGTLLRCGDVLLEITQIGKACHSHCAVYEAVGDCIMPREGVFAKVLEGGVIHPGDEMVEVERGEKRPYQAAVITLSDKGSQGLRQDESGPVIVKRLEQEGYDVVEKILLPDGRDELEQHLRRLADQRQVDLILTTGGTGFGQRDVTPEATIAVADRQVPGIAEAIRAASMKVTERGEKRPYQAAVITLSDKGSQGLRQDESGPVIVKRLEQEGYDVVEKILLPDGRDELEQHLRRLADQRQVDLILTTGGTGFGQRDVTPEATIAVADRQVPGIAEAIRAASMKVTQRAMLSRAVSVIRKKTLIINLPGSPKACQECMDVFLETIPHGLDLLRGGVSDCARK